MLHFKKDPEGINFIITSGGLFRFSEIDVRNYSDKTQYPREQPIEHRLKVLKIKVEAGETF